MFGIKNQVVTRIIHRPDLRLRAVCPCGACLNHSKCANCAMADDVPPDKQGPCCYGCTHTAEKHKCCCGNWFHHMCAGAAANGGMLSEEWTTEYGRCGASANEAALQQQDSDAGSDEGRVELASPEEGGEQEAAGNEEEAPASRWANVQTCLCPVGGGVCALLLAPRRFRRLRRRVSDAHACSACARSECCELCAKLTITTTKQQPLARRARG